MLADIQLWRTKIVTAKADEVARWQTAIEKMPAEVQAGGWFLLGEAKARLGQAEEASLAYLRVPLVHGRPRAMGADALVAAGEQLEKLDRKEQAAGLYREVLADYATCPAASEAQARLSKLK
jgi:TolA-binding protein